MTLLMKKNTNKNDNTIKRVKPLGRSTKQSETPYQADHLDRKRGGRDHELEANITCITILSIVCKNITFLFIGGPREKPSKQFKQEPPVCMNLHEFFKHRKPTKLSN